MDVVGIDLSGPSNVADTAVAHFRVARGGLRLCERVLGADDAAIAALLRRTDPRADLVVGLDAPLSYNDGGGDRPADRRLRRGAVESGLRAGSVMPPTLTRMAYLTLRGMAVARMATAIVGPRVRVVEVHPGATLALRGAPPAAVRGLKGSAAARRTILAWLEDQGLRAVAGRGDPGDHFVAACAAALAAWKWGAGAAAWIHPADPPQHPFDVAC
jgi:predicted nuclease with RNAse H fold